MAVYLPNGATIYIASGYGADKVMSALSNAAEGVATLEASHGIVEDDILVVTSGWSQLNGRVVRADSVSTNDVTLEDIDTSDTDDYPAGSGTGTVKEVSGWTQIQQVLGAEGDGGEQQFVTYRFLEDSKERRIPTFKSAEGMTLNIADDDTLAHYPLLVSADKTRLPQAIKVQLPSGDVIFYNAYVTFNKTPSLTIDEVAGLEITLSFVAEPTRY
jgi:hypothetical protein